jgi:hypothetical protein
MTLRFAKQMFKIIELPIRYRDQTYGTTNASAGDMVCCCCKWSCSPRAG